MFTQEQAKEFANLSEKWGIDREMADMMVAYVNDGVRPSNEELRQVQQRSGIKDYFNKGGK